VAALPAGWVYVFVSVPLHTQVPTNGSAAPPSSPPLLLPLPPPLLLPLPPPLLLVLLPLLPPELLPALLLLHAAPTARAPVRATAPRKKCSGNAMVRMLMALRFYRSVIL
jgi:hypothetical protein